MNYNILDFGAVADGVTDNRAAIQAAIDACAKTGGTVTVPAGRYHSGTLRLRSDMDFHLERGSVLIASHNPKEMVDYTEEKVDSSSSNGVDGMEDGYFLYACHEKNLTISGEGMIDGGGREVYYDDDSDGGFHENPLAVKGFRPRTSYLEDVDGLTVTGITFYDSCFWTLHLAGCRNVLVEKIRILNNDRGPNNDGIDPDSCQNVVIRGCLIETGDDAIVLKTTRPITEKYGDCENVVISDCILHSRDSALKIGTETWGNIRNVIFCNSVIRDCSRGIGLWVRDGGVIENVQMHHLTGNAKRYAEYVTKEKPVGWWGKGEPVFLSAAYRNAAHRFPGTIRNITADHLMITGEAGFFFAADGDGVIEDVSIRDSAISIKKQSLHTPEYFDEQPSPQSVYRHELSWLYGRKVKNAEISCRLSVSEEMKPYFEKAPILEECENVRIG